jgi:hypothetical protein
MSSPVAIARTPTVEREMNASPYTTEFLQEGKCESTQFVKDISIQVRTDALCEVVSTCYTSSLYPCLAI